MTLNQAIRQLRRIVIRHSQINSYYFGDLSNWTEFDGLTYTSCLITLNDATYNAPTTTLNLSIWISDRLVEDSSNLNEVHSDTLQILIDILAAIDDIGINWRPDLSNKQILFFDDARGNDNADMVAGVKYDFSISLYNALDRCVFPVKERLTLLTESGFELLTEEDGQKIVTD